MVNRECVPLALPECVPLALPVPLFRDLVLVLLVCGSSWLIAGVAEGEALRFYVGTYTDGDSQGIYLCELDLETGAVTVKGLAAESTNPSFLAIHPTARWLYAVNETEEFGGQRSGGVSAFSIDADSGRLTLLNQQPSGGGAPCHLVVDRTGKYVLVANYSGGSVAAIRIQDDGSLGERTAFVQHEGSSVDPSRQQQPHAHSINLDAANRFAFAADLGLDKVLVYRFNAQRGSLVAAGSAAVKPGAGPRHFALHPSMSFAYVINEIQSTITAFAYDAQQGVLRELQTISTLPEGFSGTSHTAEVQVSPDGKFVFGSNRGHDSIAVFAVDPERGTLSHVQTQPTGGRTPRNFGIDPSGRYLLAANQGTNNVIVFRIDPESGRLMPTGQEVELPSPVCVKFVMAP